MGGTITNTYILPLPKQAMFLDVLDCLFVSFLSVRPQDYLKSDERIFMTRLPEVCREPRNNPLNFVDVPDCAIRGSQSLTDRLVY